MNKRDPMIGKDGEVGELGKDFFATARRGRPPMPPGTQKVRMNMMIEAELAERLKSVGNKSAFVNDALRKALAGQQP